MTEQLTSFLDFQRKQQERLETEQRRQTLFARTAATRRRGALADRPGFRGLVNVGAAAGQLTDVRLRARIEQLRGRGQAEEQVEAFDVATAAEQTGRAEQRRVQTGEEFAITDRLQELRDTLSEAAGAPAIRAAKTLALQKLRAIMAERGGRFANRPDVQELFTGLFT